jgi:hypothetical protein
MLIFLWIKTDAINKIYCRRNLALDQCIILLFLLFQVVGKDLSDPMRSHMDLAKNIAPHYEDAVNYYEKLSKQLVNQGHVFDLFACSLDQVSVHILFFGSASGQIFNSI